MRWLSLRVSGVGLALSVVVLVGACAGCGDAGAADSPRADNEPPIAILQVPASARLGQTILLDGSASSDPDGTLARYLFEVTAYDAPSARVLSSASPRLTTTFEVAGRFEVVLTVIDSDGTKASDVATIDVE